MTDILILTFGLFCGFLSSSPPGAINLWIVNQTLNHRKESALFLLGIIAADCVYATLAVWGYHNLIEGTTIETGMLAVGAFCIIVMGLMTLLYKNKQTVELTMSEKPLKQFALGLLMCGGNPAFLVFWIFAVGALEEQLDINIEGFSLLFFTVGIAAGDFFWFRFIISLVKKVRNKVTSRYLLLINKTVGVTFLVIGTYALIELI